MNNFISCLFNDKNNKHKTKVLIDANEKEITKILLEGKVTY
jgi:hypothetical protein